jgi:hypothetical protein
MIEETVERMYYVAWLTFFVVVPSLKEMGKEHRREKGRR